MLQKDVTEEQKERHGEPCWKWNSRHLGSRFRSREKVLVFWASGVLAGSPMC